MRKGRKIFVITLLLCFFVSLFPQKSLAIDWVRDIPGASRMEEQAEIIGRPHGLPEKKYNLTTCGLKELITNECRLRIDSEEVGKRSMPYSIQVTPPKRPEEEIELIPENAEENIVKAQGFDPLGWLRKIISDFTAGPSGHFRALKPEIVEVKGWESASDVLNEVKIMETVVGDSLTVPFQYAQKALLPAEFEITPTPLPPGTPTLTPPPSNGYCEEGNNYCSRENLKNYFKDEEKARKASIICQKESGSNPFAINKGCLTGKFVDYSIGLFQINLLAHCCPEAFVYSWSPPSCRVLNWSRVNECENIFLDPVKNIRKAVGLSSNGTNWSVWSAARVCGIK